MSQINTAGPQVVNTELEQGRFEVQPEVSYHRGTGSDPSSMSTQVTIAVPGNTADIRNMRAYYESINHEPQNVQNAYTHAGVSSSFVVPTTMYNPIMSPTAVNIYMPQTQSFGLANVSPPTLYHQATGTMEESSSGGLIKMKNAVNPGNNDFLYGFAGSSSSAHIPQNPPHGPWNASFHPNYLPNSAAPNHHYTSGWPFLEGSSADVPNSFMPMVTHTELVHRADLQGLFPACPMGQCNTWIPQTANSINGPPQWGHGNAVPNLPGLAVNPGTTDIPNGGHQDYQAGHSIHRPIPNFYQTLLHHMEAPQMQTPQQQLLVSNVVHGGNPSTGLPLDPRMLALPFHPMNPPLGIQVDNGIRILPYQNATMMDHSRIYEAVHIIDEHRDMRLDVDDMTYEELVALGEQIGDVNTGLAESYIQEKLKSSLYVPGAVCMSDQRSEFSVETDACIICQEEYEAKDLIGTLGCGHKYHATCIKQWLMRKNLCPICKTTALPAERRNG